MNFKFSSILQTDSGSLRNHEFKTTNVAGETFKVLKMQLKKKPTSFNKEKEILL